MSVAPIVETERLRLRPFTADDADAIAFYADPEVMRYIPGGPRDPETLASRFNDMLARRNAEWENGAFGMWAVVVKATGDVIGHCGLQRLPGSSDVEVFYLLAREHWQRGYATEAARAAIHFGFTSARLARIVAIAMPNNLASLHVMEKAGMRLVGPARHYDIDVVKYEITAKTP